MHKNNKAPLKNDVFDEFTKKERALIKARLLAWAIERRVKNIYQGIKKTFYIV
tara:strand:- start:239 stop:397 length:159 start_codon:yes stop_codon:yes gene_type:complete